MYWLIKMLCAPNNKVAACPVQFPDTAFYQNGVCIDLVNTCADTGFLQSFKQHESKLKWDKLTIHFVTVTRERMKYTNRLNEDSS